MKRLVLQISALVLLLMAVIVPGVNAASHSNIAKATTFAASCRVEQKGFVASRALFPPWYKYLPGDDSSGKCRPTFNNNQIGSTVVKIGAAVIELLINIAGLVAAGFVIYGAIQYVVSQGDPTGLSNAKSTILNALIGLVIVVLASGIVQFIGNSIKT